MGIARDNTLIVMNNIGEAIVGTFEQIAIAMNSDESSFTKFSLRRYQRHWQGRQIIL